MLRAADTVGVFQVESRAQMATLPRMKPTHFYDLVVEVAIIRPGPIVGKMVNPYLARRNGREPVRYPHPSLEPILARTLGVPLFQEQLIRMAMTAAGFTGGQADELRRAMGFKRSQERMNTIEVALRAGMARNGIGGAAQDEIIQGIKSFALYGFPESHAASFALLAYASAYLKAYHHAAFTAALLNAWPMGFYHPATLVNDAVRHDVEVAADRRHALGLALRRRGRRARAAARPPLRRGPARGDRHAASRRRGRRRRGRRWPTSRRARRRTSASWRRWPRSARWRRWAGRAGRRCGRSTRSDESGPLFARADRLSANDVGDAPLPEMTGDEEMEADFHAGSISTGPHPISFARDALDRDGVTRAADLRRVANGRRVAHRRRRDRPPAPRHRQGLRVHHARGRDRLRQRHRHAPALRPAQARDRRVDLAGHRRRRAEPGRRRVDQGRSLLAARRSGGHRRHLARLSLTSG